jgi:single-strand DNA-binding protein
MRCLVEGKIQTRKWQDSQGIDRYSTEIVLQQYAGELCLLDGLKEAESRKKEEKHESNGNGSLGGSNARSYDDFDDEIPF